ncbi:MAG: acyl-CoA dehydrogenase domain-containing protein, partial [Gammaproteobacteria bacterium]
RLYQVIPISITVEGANILTRSMMIFGQGAVRCHPYIQREMAALNSSDAGRGLREFDTVLLEHIGFFLRNLVAACWMGLTGARFAKTPGNFATRRYYRRIARLSACFAVLADIALLTLGGALKRRERLSGLFADALSNLYLCSCALKHYQNQGKHPEDKPLLHWACQQSLYRAQQSLLAVFRKLPLPYPLVWPLRVLLFPLGKPCTPPGDALIHQAASLLLHDSPARDRLTRGIYINDKPNDPTGRIEVAFKAVLKAEPVESRIRKAQKEKLLPKGDPAQAASDALAKGLISQQEADLIAAAQQARLAAITVDDFGPEELTGRNTGR